jgi:hypothetical protein
MGTAMSAIDRFVLLIRDLRRSERGMALPVAMFATVASISLGGAAIMASVDVQQGTKRDSSAKSAIAAADAGARVAMMRLNRNQVLMTGTTRCVGPNGEIQVPQLNGWCPETLPETVGSSTFTYQFAARESGVCEGYALCAVATGMNGDVTRRVLINFDDDGQVEPPDGDPPDEDPPGGDPGGGDPPTGEEGLDETDGIVAEGLIGEDSITMSGNADVQVGVGTNGNLITSGNASICGDIRVGVGKKWIPSGNASQCDDYEQTQGNRTLPPVSSFIPSTISSVNSNYRLTKCKSTGVPAGCQSDTYAGGKWTDTNPFDPKTRRIQASGNTTLTLGGGDYWICSISLSGNSELIMAEGAHVRIFFDTPENCGTTTQISLSGNNRIAATGYQPDEEQYDMPGFFLLGSPTMQTTINLSGNYTTTQEFVIYAPRSTINVSGNATMKGLIAGKTLNISGNGEILNDEGFRLPPELNPWYDGEEDPGSEDPPDEDPPGGDPPDDDPGSKIVYYTAQGYVECAGVPASTEAPDANC